MAGKVTVFLPPSTDVVVKGFSNAVRLQRITLTASFMSPIVLEGGGEQNTLFGRSYFTTPAGTGPTPVAIVIESSDDGGHTWKPSDIFSDNCHVQSFYMTVIVTEDLTDEDYNDAVCLVTWPQADDGGDAQ